MKRAQLIADVVSVICPYCGEPQPNPEDGSEQWELLHFARGTSKTCTACDKRMVLGSDTKVQFK